MRVELRRAVGGQMRLDMRAECGANLVWVLRPYQTKADLGVRL